MGLSVLSLFFKSLLPKPSESSEAHRFGRIIPKEDFLYGSPTTPSVLQTPPSSPKPLGPNSPLSSPSPEISPSTICSTSKPSFRQNLPSIPSILIHPPSSKPFSPNLDHEASRKNILQRCASPIFKNKEYLRPQLTAASSIKPRTKAYMKIRLQQRKRKDIESRKTRDERGWKKAERMALAKTVYEWDYYWMHGAKWKYVNSLMRERGTGLVGDEVSILKDTTDQGASVDYMLGITKG
ncbi:MAG: hypothetical protein Q9204_002803 [Flavoplaca sp. TL-2023a]